MLLPDSIKPGDKIAITAPAGKIKHAGIEKSIHVFKSWGLNVVIGKTVGSSFNTFSAIKEKRLEELQQFLDDPNIKAIVCARGGYGLIQIIDKINLAGIKKYPKWVSGLSDITNLHAILNNNGIASVHGFMPVSFSKKDSGFSIQSLKEVLFGNLKSINIKPSNYNLEGKARGILVGGNLSILYSLIGTPFDVDLKNKILFIEEVAEHHYHIHRMLNSFKLAGKFNGLKGIVAGGFSNLKDGANEFGSTVEEIILDIAKPFNLPVAFNLGAGHVNPNISFYLGREIELKASSDSATITYL